MIYIYFIISTSLMGYAMAANCLSVFPIALLNFDELDVTTGTWSVVRRTQTLTPTSRCEKRTFFGDPINAIGYEYMEGSLNVALSVSNDVAGLLLPNDGNYLENTDQGLFHYRFVKVDGTKFVITYKCGIIGGVHTAYTEVLTQMDPVSNYNTIKTSSDAALTAARLDPTDLVKIDHSNCEPDTSPLGKFAQLKQQFSLNLSSNPLLGLLSLLFNVMNGGARNITGNFNRGSENN